MAERIPWWKAFSGRVLSNILKDAEIQQCQGVESKNSNFSSDNLDDFKFEPAFMEGTFSRNLTISKSGRFKEKRKARANLPGNKNL